MEVSRRWILAGCVTWPLPGLAETRSSSFSFFHFTETHITDALNAIHGCRQCFVKINSLGGDFAIAGGDLVYDVCAQGWNRSLQLYGYYREAVRTLEMPVHHVIGNHDVYGLFRESGVSENDRHFGKRLFEEHIGPRYYSFAHKGWRFIVLDSIGITPNRKYTAFVDSAQIEWLRNELTMIDRKTPIIVITHVPLVTGYLGYGSLTRVLAPESLVVANANDVLDRFAGYNLKAVLQGHLHVREMVDNGMGCRFIISGAVCGNWWRGPRDGHPEGFSRFTVHAGAMTWRYYTYGFRASENSGSAVPSIVVQPSPPVAR